MLPPKVFLLKVSLVVTVMRIGATPPLGYEKPTEGVDENIPNYEYAYNIEDEKGQGQGKQEARKGIHGKGRYYVEGSDQSQSVEYVTDDWGYHPAVEYSNVTPHSKTSTKLLIGEEARNLKENFSKSPKEEIKKSIEAANDIPTTTQSITEPATQRPQYEVTTVPDFYQTVATYLNNQNSNHANIQQNIINDFSSSGQLLNLVQEHISQLNSEEVSSSEEKPSAEGSFRTAALFEGSQTNIVKSSNDYEDGIRNLEKLGGFGTKLSGKLLGNTVSYQKKQMTYNPNPSTLIESTRNLVSGEDVLSLNEAASSTPESTQITDEESQVVTQTVPQNLLSLQPIVVEESEESKVSTTPVTWSTPQADGNSGVTVPTTVLVTPKTVTTEFYKSFPKTEQPKKVVDIQVQKSVPYYIGKFEYPMPYAYQDVNIEEKEKNKTYVAMQNFELGNILLNFPVPSIPAETQHLSNVDQTKQDSSISVQQEKNPGKYFSPHVDLSQQRLPVYNEIVSFKQSVLKMPSSEVEFRSGDEDVDGGGKKSSVKNEKDEEEEKSQQQLPQKEAENFQESKFEKVVDDDKHHTHHHQQQQKPPQQPQQQGYHYVSSYSKQELPKYELNHNFKDFQLIVGMKPPQFVSDKHHVHLQQGYQYNPQIQNPEKEKHHLNPEHIHHHHHHHHNNENKPQQAYNYGNAFTKQQLPVFEIANSFSGFDLQEASNQQVQIPANQLLIGKPQVFSFIPQTDIFPVEQTLKNPISFNKPYTGKPLDRPFQISIPQPYPVDKLVHQPEPKPTFFTQPFYLPLDYLSNPLTPSKPLPFRLTPPPQPPSSYLPQDQIQAQQQLPPAHYRRPSPTDCDQDGSHSIRNVQYVKGGNHVGSAPFQYRKARSHLLDNVKLEYGFLPPMVPSLEIDENGNPVEKGQK